MPSSEAQQCCRAEEVGVREPFETRAKLVEDRPRPDRVRPVPEDVSATPGSPVVIQASDNGFL